MVEYLKTVIAACQAGDDHTPRQMALLALLRLSKKPLRYGAVAVELNISKFALTRAANRLAEEGLLVRIPTPWDKRQVDLGLTEKGRALLEWARTGFAPDIAAAA